MRVATVFIFLLLIAPVATAEPGSIFDVLNMTVVDGDLESGGAYFDGCNRSWAKTTRYTNIGDIKPGVVPAHHISASINIVGYDGVALFDGVKCISGCPADLAIVESYVSTSYAGFEANKDWVKHVITVKSSGGNTTATMRVSFLWHWTTYSSVTGAVRKHYVIEYKTVSVTKPHPKILSIDDTNVFAQITMYNNTFDPYSLIQVDVPENITVTTFKYKNNTAKHFNSVGVSNVSHVEYIDAGMWKTTPNQDLMLPYGDLCLIRDAPLNLSELQIQISTPYTTENVTNCTITIITGTATDYINFKCMFVYIIMVSLCLLCAGLNVRRLHL